MKVNTILNFIIQSIFPLLPIMLVTEFYVIYVLFGKGWPKYVIYSESIQMTLYNITLMLSLPVS